uniref:Uncharacterized protein n=1 Tax=Macrostomum lignano TaxID=282301 RepID=A0A1I8FBN7_9PLAT
MELFVRDSARWYEATVLLPQPHRTSGHHPPRRLQSGQQLL